MNNRFISFEGIDGAGKSTHLDWFCGYLGQKIASPARVITTREPGGTLLGEQIRNLLLHEPMQAETEALLMFAARHEHVETIIKPALACGNWVVCDRFADASFAYQSGGKGIPPDRIAALENWTLHGFQPDMTVLFDLPVDIARARCAAAHVHDKFEAESAAFFERVRRMYLQRAYTDPQRFVVIDATHSIADIQQILQKHAARLLTSS